MQTAAVPLLLQHSLGADAACKFARQAAHLCRASTVTAASSSSAFLHTTLPIESVSISYCRPRKQTGLARVGQQTGDQACLSSRTAANTGGRRSTTSSGCSSMQHAVAPPVHAQDMAASTHLDNVHHWLRGDAADVCERALGDEVLCCLDHLLVGCGVLRRGCKGYG